VLAELDVVPEEFHYTPYRHERSGYSKGEGDDKDHNGLEVGAEQVQRDRAEQQHHPNQKYPDRVVQREFAGRNRI